MHEVALPREQHRLRRELSLREVDPVVSAKPLGIEAWCCREAVSRRRVSERGEERLGYARSAAPGNGTQEASMRHQCVGVRLLLTQARGEIGDELLSGLGPGHE